MSISKPFQNNDSKLHKNPTPKNKLHHLFGAFIPTYFPPWRPFFRCSCKASNSFCRCSNRCWCAASLDAQVAFSSASMARSWNETVQTLEAYWSPQVGAGWTTSNNHLHPFTMNHQPQSINHNNNQQPQRPQSSLLCPASANDSPAPVKERCISTISTFNSPMRFIFLDNGTLKIRLKWRNK